MRSSHRYGFKNFLNGFLANVRVFAAVFLLALAVQVASQEEDATENDEATAPATPDTSRWQCRNCEFPYGLTGDILFGAGYVSESFFEFGNFRGLEDKGIFGAFGVDLLYRSEDAHYLEFYGEKLGLDSRALSIEGGRQGTYRAWLDYDEIPYFRADDTRTIFQGAGTNDQRLPADWFREGTTDAMTRLDASLRGVDIKHERESLGLGISVNKPDPWKYSLDIRRTTRDGTAIRGASFIFRATELAAPVDYETTQLDAAAGFVKERWEMELAYSLSVFDNRNRSVRWENPFLAIFDASLGELAEPPDNSFHQVMLSGSWRQSRWLTVAGQFAVGRMEQDEQFLQPSLNPRFSGVGVPVDDLDGEVNTRIANLRVTSNVTSRLRAKVQLDYDERDNDSRRESFEQVVSDTFLTGARVNERFSYERAGIKTTLDYQLFSFLRLSATASHQETERTLQEVEDTDTQKYVFDARASPFGCLNIGLQLSREERDNDLDPALLGPQENPRLRRFHFAEKERDALRFNADYAILENLFAGVFLEIADEEFNDTEIGLSDGRAESYGLDLSTAFSRHVTGHAFVSVESLEADIIGADFIDGAPWQADQDDDFTTLGFGMNFGELPGKWVRGALDVTYASADGEIRIDKVGETALPFPRLKTRRFTLEASIERMLRERLNLRLGYLAGKLTEDDFFRDNVAPDTVPTLLSLGEGTPDGTVHVVSATLRYRFQ